MSRSYPSIYCTEYENLTADLMMVTSPEELAEKQKALLMFVDRHVDGLRLLYERRGKFTIIQPGTEVFVQEQKHLVRSGRVYGHRVIEIGGDEPVLDYYVHLFYENLGVDEVDPVWINSAKIFTSSSKAFE